MNKTFKYKYAVNIFFFFAYIRNKYYLVPNF